MRRTIRIMRVTYPDIQVPQWQGRKLRGFFASGGEAGSLLHNHSETGAGLYRYPLVQYKVLRKAPVILALEEGIPEVHPLVMERQELLLGDRRYPCGNVEIGLSAEVLGDTEQVCRYRFCAPWFGLNQENYRIYEKAGKEERKALLERVLAGNLLSMAKGLGVWVEGRLKAEAQLEERPVRFKDETVLGFMGEFSVNFLIPDLFGIGKSVSRGFGTVYRKKQGSGHMANASENAKNAL